MEPFIAFAFCILFCITIPWLICQFPGISRWSPITLLDRSKLLNFQDQLKSNQCGQHVEYTCRCSMSSHIPFLNFSSIRLIPKKNSMKNYSKLEEHFAFLSQTKQYFLVLCGIHRIIYVGKDLQDIQSQTST